jgi:hypothetical protein
MLYSGHEDENAAHRDGMAIMFTSTAQKALVLLGGKLMIRE